MTENPTWPAACPVDALHDSVIQRLFATGLLLQSALGRITDVRARQHVQQSVQVLDEVVGEVRSAMHRQEASTKRGRGPW